MSGITPGRIAEFVRSIAHGLREGWPVREHKRVQELFVICATCPHYVPRSRLVGHCGLCGCIVAGDKRQINKLRCAWEECPEGKWGAEEGVEPRKGCEGCGG